ncbi:hypothetical protein [Luteolibacter luteus]|uniref:Photosynthesis system II assembly factor Ycf48/Hcf136-like domain-containing protein n=1 Tax=Luteolibacter luteus TaxID=2728835 RepID=A0A858RI12_9BACT|nr:hypothetical protein [Luteolibacter luteus]QJE96355.1 hypothetical protein HHL09_11350 [Luteolibacter luteus]
MMKVWMAIVSICLALALGSKADEVGTSWHRVDGGAADRFAEICWDGPVAVAVGSRGLIGTSTDGKSWATRFLGVQANLTDVAWSGSHYLVVGSGGVILRSTDGTVWQRIEAPASQNYQGVTWSGSQFMALDNYYYISTSPDGLVWNRTQVAVETPCYGIDNFDGTTYLRNNWGITRSSDLVEWTQVLSLSNNNLPAGIRKLNGRLFSVGPRQFPRTSVDGITWTSPTMTGPSFVSQELADIAWNGSHYLAVGRSGWNFVWRSEDGIAWTAEKSVMASSTYVRWINGEFVAGDDARQVQTSPDGREWTKKGEHTQGNAVVWTGSRYIMVGNYGYIAVSADFETWTTRASGIHTHLQSVVWTGSFALAAGADGVVLKSDDGLVWTKVPGDTFAGLVRLAWTGTQVFAFSSNGTDTSTDGVSWNRISTLNRGFYDVKRLRDKFIAIGYMGALESSPDGIAWTSGTSGTSGPLYAAAASDSEFMVGGQGGILLASPDGIEWTPRAVPSPGITVSSLEYRFGKWFLATTNGLYQSADGIAWTGVPSIQGVSILSDQLKLVWTGSKLVCTGLEAWTSDGIHWEQSGLRRAAPDFKAVSKGPGGYVAVGTKGAIWHSPDGYAWQAVTSPTASDLDVVAAGAGCWVAAGSGGVILSSPDGMQWSLRNSGTTKNLTDIAWNGQRFAATGEGGTVLTSVDGSSWFAQPSGFATSFLNVEAAGAAFKAFGGAGVLCGSPDGLAWTTSVPDWISDVVWNGTSYVAVAQGSGNSAWSYVSSPDALQWSRYPIGLTSYLTGICWTGTLHVACGTGGTIVTSPDGVNWTPRDSGTAQWIQAVIWNGSQLVAVGKAGTLLYSPDGITWNKGATSGSNPDFEDVAWAGGRYMAVGYGGGSATSTDGITWQSSYGIFGTSRTVEWVGTRFLAGGEGLFSTTGLPQWTMATTTGLPAAVYDLEPGGSLLLAATTGGVYRLQETTAGRWNTITKVYPSPWLDNLTHNGSEFVGVGSSGTIVLSRDGSSWQTVRGGREAAYAATAWGGGRFVGVGSNRIESSADGALWNPAVSPLGSANFTLTDVGWTGSRFVAVGPSAMMLRSNGDGSAWTSIGNNAKIPLDMTGIAGDDSLLVVVGTGGMIAVSDGSGEAVSDYQMWIAGQGVAFGSAAPLQDANADGIDNLLAYVHGIPAIGPVSSTQRAALPSVSFDAETGKPVLTFELRESYRPGMIYQVEVSRDLKSGTWQSLQRFAAGWADSPGFAQVTQSALPGGGLRIEISNFPDIGTTGCFFRLRATLP